MKRAMMKKRRYAGILFLLFVLSPFGLTGAKTSQAETIDDLKQTISQMKATMELLQQKVAELEEKQTAAAETVADSNSSNGGALIVPKDTSIKLYGYAKLDTIYTDKDGGGKNSYVPSAVPLDSEADTLASNALTMHAKQSRLGIFTSTPTDYGQLNTRIETDFYGSGGNEAFSNSYGIRLRRAYGELGNLLIGQEWSTFIDLASYPETIDFGGPAGSLFIRQAQIRWTQPYSFGSLQFALENPESVYQSKDELAPTAGSGEYLPDLIVRANFDTALGHFSLAGLGRQIIVDSGLYEDESYGGAISATASLPLFDKDKMVMQFNYGNALGRYMEAEFADAFINPATHNIETSDQWGGLVSYQHFWTNSLRSTLVYSYAERDNDLDVVSDTADSIYQSVHANLLWSPVSQVNIGLEYIYATREIENGEDGDINRVQLGFQYSF
ncbi:DcaP family trimeric outer membrane transporter [Desulforhopalus sp. IMCC35007]|uniref:DcaP family trimeric outer membrane transporter n=1 Tax=Desulforhopalus sp. IMCC35007 TaxID=2569543 RepID=UPI00145CAEE4|nr:DcaP family trimeric outer membrane transporter [Desulforhopalus sp. IMCC35007]